MNARWRHAVCGMLFILLLQMGSARAQPAELKSALPSATLSGQSRFKSFGFDIYDARLWVGPGFKADEYERHAFALELAYLRDFSSESIAKRSIDEMKRQPRFPQAQSDNWERMMRDSFPNIGKGDRIMGIYRPDNGTVFFTNGVQSGHIHDPAFGKFFFGIWLSAQTSEPGLRQALLAGAATN